jgi:hypothetical protein
MYVSEKNLKLQISKEFLRQPTADNVELEETQATGQKRPNVG